MWNNGNVKENDKFIINGLAGQKILKGSIAVNGAKNEALKILASTILFRDGFELTNVPEIEDVNRSLELLDRLGIKTEWVSSGQYRLTVPQLTNFTLPGEIAKKLRASLVFAGPLLARLGRVVFPYPGGCLIGKRPIDLFLDGFVKMGARVEETNDTFELFSLTESGQPSKLRGAEIFFKNQSVIATETFILAGVLAEGRTILKNCALEPEVASLGEWLNQGGARISGLGTSTIVIEGGELLTGAGQSHRIMPDRIEAGSFILLGALAAAELMVTGCRPDHLEAFLALLAETGVAMEVGPDWIKVINRPGQTFTATDIKTHEYPGFPTDLQAPFAVFLTQAVGQSRLFETIFEGRLNYLEGLKFMGAKINILDVHRAIIDEPTPLSGREIESPDLRAGLAYVLAATVASGRSIVHNVKYIDRGYEDVSQRLASLGLDIKRVSVD